MVVHKLAIWNLLNHLESTGMKPDKKKHAIVNIAIVLVTLTAFLFVKREMYGYDKFIAVGLSFFISAGKEIVWDKWLKRGTCDFYDFFTGISAGWLTMFAWVIVETIIQEIQ